jgi:hypothetical protein
MGTHQKTLDVILSSFREFFSIGAKLEQKVKSTKKEVMRKLITS